MTDLRHAVAKAIADLDAEHLPRPETLAVARLCLVLAQSRAVALQSPSGFDNWRPAPELSPEAKARVLAKMESSRRARMAAYVSSQTAVVG